MMVNEVPSFRHGLPEIPPPITSEPTALCLNDNGLSMPITTGSINGLTLPVTIMLNASTLIGNSSPNCAATWEPQAPAQLITQLASIAPTSVSANQRPLAF
ncbi:hypothetical protein D3C86_1590070 [compost metagenome]